VIKVTSRSAVRLIPVPYDSGYREQRQGRGPADLIEYCFGRTGGFPETVPVETASSFPAEISATAELIGRLAREVSSALRDGRFPMVLAGNCNTSAIGGAAGLRIFDPAAKPGVIWFDGHADFNTPQTDPLGFLDGQGLAMLTGRCWQALLRRVPGFEPLADTQVLLIGGHDLDDEERAALASSAITHPVEMIRAITLTWLFSGQRSDEIARLRVGCVRWQHDGIPISGDCDQVLARDAVCLLDIPVHKTGTAFTKPVDPLLGKAIEAWQAVRPDQPKMLDPKTGERAEFLFAIRAKRVAKHYINEKIIPMLCRKA
jgi:arginase family protein